MDYHPDKPLLPLLREIADEQVRAIMSIDQSHPLARVAVLERLVENLVWLVGKLAAERDAALGRKEEA